MIYPIEQKNDLSGAMLVIRFPEEELDRKALSTIQADPPAFLVPFRYPPLRRRKRSVLLRPGCREGAVDR